MERVHGALIAALALAGLLAFGLPLVAGSAVADHQAERVLLLVIDGPRHDMAFDEQGPLAPLYETGNVSFAEDAWTAGRAKTVPGHAALLTGAPQTIKNDGSEGPEDPLVWEALAEAHGWGPEEMRFLYQKAKLGVLRHDDVGGGPLGRENPDETMLEAIEENSTDLDEGLLVAAFAHPDHTGHVGEWDDHEASLETIGDGLATLFQAQADEDTLIVATADHARSCEEPAEHGRPTAPDDGCDAHIPLWAAGWHVTPGERVEACITQADVGVLVANALGADLEDATGRFPQPLVDTDAEDAWEEEGCPPDRGGSFSVPAPSAGISALAVATAALASIIAPRRRGPLG